MTELKMIIDGKEAESSSRQRMDVMQRPREQYGVELFAQRFRPPCDTGIDTEIPRECHHAGIDVERHDLKVPRAQARSPSHRRRSRSRGSVGSRRAATVSRNPRCGSL